MSKSKEKEVKPDRVENVHEEGGDEYQEVLEKKAKALVAFMNEEPRARLIPKLRISEDGVSPDIRLVLIKEKDEDSSTGTETESEGDGGNGTEEAGTTESTESQDS